jgi:U4/U6 small nuclear ribonucleoprotein PRP31
MIGFPLTSVSVAGSTTAGRQLTELELSECFKGCDETLRLDRDKMLVLAFVESMMHRIAPNLCAMVGSSIAAQLIGLAG